MRILQVIGTLDPAYGGPVEALKQQAREFQRRGHRVETLCLDSDDQRLSDTSPSLATHFPGRSFLKYKANLGALRWLTGVARNFDVIVVHGIWQFQSLAACLATRASGTPYVVFVHGALDPWFKHAYPFKQVKKWVYWMLVELWTLRMASAALYTCTEEQRLAKQSFIHRGISERVVHYGISRPEENIQNCVASFIGTYPKLQGKRFILFLSRLHKKKGCDNLINAFVATAAQYPDVHLVVAGPDKDELGSKISTIARTARIEDRVHLLGLIDGEVKAGAYYAADAFILPSHSENFGLVVAEALARSLPVLISNKVNIWPEIEQERAGIVRPDTFDGTRELLEAWLSLPEGERANFKRRAAHCYDEHFEFSKASETLMGILAEAAHSPPQT